MNHTPYYTILPNRGLLKISGADRKSFLQGLITNDINLLEKQPCLYACLLTPQGKFMFDFFITEENDTLYLDCEGGERVHELKKMLTMYALRAEIKIEAADNIAIYVGNSDQLKFKDPRHPDIGFRDVTKPANIPEEPFETWDKHRIKLCIPDGSRDMIPNKSTMAEYNMDDLNAINYKKGCYVGQELTARMHYRGLAKKHLRTVTPQDLELRHLPQFGEPITKDGKTIGEMRSSCEDIGLALIKS